MSFEQKFFRTVQHEIVDEEQAAQHWRRVLLKLSNNFNAASAERADLSPVLMEALHHALENLLLLGDEAHLMALEEWVDIEHAQNPNPLPGDESYPSHHNDVNTVEMRDYIERRFTERRIASHFQLDAASGSDAANGSAEKVSPHNANNRRENSDRRSSHQRRIS